MTRWPGTVLLYYCSVCRATWRPTWTPRRSTSTRRWRRPSRPATPAGCRSSPAGRTRCRRPARRAPAAPARCPTSPGRGRRTRPGSSPCRRRASAEDRRPGLATTIGAAAVDRAAATTIDRLCVVSLVLETSHRIPSAKHGDFGLIVIRIFASLLWA